MKPMKQKNKKMLMKRLKQPKGEYIFSEKYHWTMKNGEDTQSLETIISNNVIVMLERNSSFDLNYVYSSPATGTRIASVNIEPMKNSSYLTFFLHWSPEDIAFKVVDDMQTSVESKTCKQAEFRNSSVASSSRMSVSFPSTTFLSITTRGLVIFLPSLVAF
jgi:hypothetical protein